MGVRQPPLWIRSLPAPDVNFEPSLGARTSRLLAAGMSLDKHWLFGDFLIVQSYHSACVLRIILSRGTQWTYVVKLLDSSESLHIFDTWICLDGRVWSQVEQLSTAGEKMAAMLVMADAITYQ